MKCNVLGIMILALILLAGCNGENPKGGIEVYPEFVCPGEEVTIQYGASNADKVRIRKKSDLGEEIIDLSNITGVITDRPNACTYYTLEGMNSQVPWVKVQGDSKKLVNVIGSGQGQIEQWAVGAVGKVTTAPPVDCEWLTKVEASSSVRIEGVVNDMNTGINVTQTPKDGVTGTVGLPTQFAPSDMFNGNSLAGEWRFTLMDASFMTNRKCSTTEIKVTVRLGCRR